jgi:hypothetical protein
MLPLFDKTQRDDLLRRMEKADTDYRAAMERDDDAAADALSDESDRLEALYFANLPNVVMGVCPFCAKPLYRGFDPHGLDGPWWVNSAEPRNPPACPHFCLLRGAVNYQGRPVLGGKFEVHAGPEVPYVIPRILNMKGMIAVIGEVLMTVGYKVYPIAYFAPRRPPAQNLTADWPRKIHRWKTQLGVTGWRFPVDPWDFDLLPWLQNDKVRWWTPPAAPAEPALAVGTPEECPYLEVSGEKQRLVVQGKYLLHRGLPDGVDIAPMDVDD